MKRTISKLVRDVMFQENKKETEFQISVFSIFLIFLFVWEPVSLYCLFSAMEAGQVEQVLTAAGVSGIFLVLFMLIQYVNNTYADCNSWKIITKVREGFFRVYYETNYFKIHHKFSQGEIFDRIFNSGMGILDYVMNYLGIIIFVFLSLGYSIYYWLKTPVVPLFVLLFAAAELYITKKISKKINAAESLKRKAESIKAEKGEKLLQDLEFASMYGVEDEILEQYIQTIDKSWEYQTRKELLSEGIKSIHSLIQVFLQIILEREMLASNRKGQLSYADSPILLIVLEKLATVMKEVIQRILEVGQKKIAVKRTLELEMYENRESRKKEEASQAVRVNHLFVELEGVQILMYVCLNIYPGEKVALIGRNGCGKSTLLKAVLGLIPTEKGECFLRNIAAQDLDKEAKKDIAYIPAEAFLFSESIQDNVEMGVEECKAEIRDSAEIFYQEFRSECVNNLSGGQKQIVNICRGGMQTPKILLADEPTSHLKKEKAEQVMKWLLDSSETCLVVTHDMSLLPLFTRVIELDGGKVGQAS